MSHSFRLITNNASYFRQKPQESPPNFSVHHVDGTCYDVFVQGRDLVHQGWILLNHPLYGNFTPGQQPYRSLLLQCADQHSYGYNMNSYKDKNIESLKFIEEAVHLYLPIAQKLLNPSCTNAENAAYLADCALIDKELMRATLAASNVVM